MLRGILPIVQNIGMVFAIIQGVPVDGPVL